MARSRNHDRRQTASTTATIADHLEEEDDGVESRIPDEVVHLNYRLLIGSVVVVSVCTLAVYLTNSWQVQRNGARLKEMADLAEAEQDFDGAIKHLTRYVTFQRSQAGTEGSSPELTESLARLANLMMDHGGSAQSAFNHYEEVLRNDPDRHAERKRLVGICASVGRNRDALEHIKYLLDNDPSAVGDVQLLQQKARSHIPLREDLAAQQTFCQVIAADPSKSEPYFNLARLVVARPDSLWSPHSRAGELETLFPQGAPAVVSAFPPSDEGLRGEQSQQMALKTAIKLLDLMVEHGQPSWEAYRRRAEFLTLLGPTLDLPARDSVSAKAVAEQLLSDLDANQDGALSGEETQSSAIPPFADINHDGRIVREELLQTLEAGGSFRRLAEAESSIERALDLVNQTAQKNLYAQRTSLATAIEVYLALAEAWEYNLSKAPKNYVDLARNAAELAVAASDGSPESQFAQAQLELQVLNFDVDAKSRQERLDKAESLLTEARKTLIATEESTKKLPPPSVRLLIDIERVLGDVLIEQIRLHPEAQHAHLKKQIREQIIPSLQAHQAEGYFVDYLEGKLLVSEQQWHAAEEHLRKADSGTGMTPELARGIGLLRALCAQKLGDPEAAIARLLAVHQADINWAPGRIELAHAYAQSGLPQYLNPAIAEYARYAADPRITPVYTRLLIDRARRQPANKQN
ncbi:MAG: hypothetical protein KF861_15190, partial [Planctomycetaceae bacterium]|nr:hypothetical protein [Planctomycetaceae bacterium]